MAVGRATDTALAQAHAAAESRRRWDLESAISGAGSGTVVVAVDESLVLDPAELMREHPQADIEVLDVRSGKQPAGGDLGGVVDATRRPELREGLFEATFPRLAPYGTFLVLDHRPAGVRRRGPAVEDRLWPRLVGSGTRHAEVDRVALDELHLLVGRAGESRPESEAAEGEAAGSQAAESQALPDVARGLVDGDSPTIAVVGDREAERGAAELHRALPGAHVLLVRSTRSGPRRHAMLAAHGPFDLLVDATLDADASADLFRRGFLHLRPGGSWVVLDGSPLRGGPTSSAAFWLALTDVLSRRGSPRVFERGPELEWSALSKAVSRVEAGPRHVVLTNRVPACAVVRDRQLVFLARRREDPAIRVQERHPSLHFASRARGPRDPDLMPETYEVPALLVREYADVVCMPHQVVTKGNLVLPDSFRHPGYTWLTNRGLRPMGRLFARAQPTPERRLEGSYFHLDGEVRHHFGHVVTEHLSRLWAWPEAKAADPELRALASFAPSRGGLLEWQLELYEAAGVPREDIVTFSEPVRVERLIGATPMFSMPTYVHPAIAEVWDRIGAALEARAGDSHDVPDRIFVTRAPGSNRWCHETPELEQIMREHGYAVIRPELLSIADQVRLFRRAASVAGFFGSGMFHLMFAEDPKEVLLIRSPHYEASNEYLIAAVRGHHVETLVPQPDAEPSGERDKAWPRPGVHRSGVGDASFHFDLDADRSRLEEILGAFG